MTDEVEEPTFVENAAEQDLQLPHCGGSEGFTCDGTPMNETFSISSDCGRFVLPDRQKLRVRRCELGSGLLPFNPISGTSYKGINLILLMGRSWEAPRWTTHKKRKRISKQLR